MDASSPGVAQSNIPRQPPTWRQSVVVYTLAIATTIAILYYGMKLEEANLRAPFTYSQDALLILPYVKATIERGSHWKNERLGAPGIQELHDFPVIDHFHFFIIWTIGLIFPDPVMVYNIYYLLTYPLTTLSAMFVMRRFNVSLLASAVGGILYAFQPYHYMREELHYFLSAYYTVPLLLLLVLKICQGKVPFFPETAEGRRPLRLHDKFGWWSIVIAIITAGAGAYYAFFSCMMLAAAGVYGWIMNRTIRCPIAAIGLIGVIGVMGVLNHIPCFGYYKEYGQNTRPTKRYSEEAEVYGMKIAQLVLPVTNHNWNTLARVRSTYDSYRRPSHNENEWGGSVFGFVGALGFIALIICCFVPKKVGWPIGALASMTLFATIYGSVGGLGSLFNHLVYAQVRATNRISIFIAFFALFAIVWAFDRYFLSRRGRVRWLRWPIMLGLLSFGLWDQLNNAWFREKGYALQRARVARFFEEDKLFFEAVEYQLEQSGQQIPREFQDGKPAAVFTFPHMPYPEGYPIGEMTSYDHVRGYLHTKSLRWSYGTMAYREWDERFRTLMDEPTHGLVERLVHMGFRGLLVDRKGISGTGKFEKLDAQLRETLGKDVPTVVQKSLKPDEKNKFGRYVFYDLTLHMKLLMESSPSHFRAMQRAEQDRIMALWLKGFHSEDQFGRVERTHMMNEKADLMFFNNSEYEKNVRLEFDVWVTIKISKPMEFQIQSDFWTETITLNPPEKKKPDDELEFMKPLHVTRNVTVPPGRSIVRWSCIIPDDHFPTDTRPAFLNIANFQIIPHR